MSRYIYAARVIGFKSVYKIGVTNNVMIRERSLQAKYKRNMKMSFNCECDRSLSLEVESAVHLCLVNFRYEGEALKGREFFRCDLSTIIDVIECAVKGYRVRVK